MIHKNSSCYDLARRVIVRMVKLDSTLTLDDHRIDVPYSHTDVDKMMGEILQDIADIFGFPPDNTVETRACDVANNTGIWPEWGICRDSILNDFLEVSEGVLDVEIMLSNIMDVAKQEFPEVPENQKVEV